MDLHLQHKHIGNIPRLVDRGLSSLMGNSNSCFFSSPVLSDSHLWHTALYLLSLTPLGWTKISQGLHLHNSNTLLQTAGDEQPHVQQTRKQTNRILGIKLQMVKLRLGFSYQSHWVTSQPTWVKLNCFLYHPIRIWIKSREQSIVGIHSSHPTHSFPK